MPNGLIAHDYMQEIITDCEARYGCTATWEAEGDVITLSIKGDSNFVAVFTGCPDGSFAEFCDKAFAAVKEVSEGYELK